MYKIKYSKELVAQTINRLAADICITENTRLLVLMNGGAWFAHQLIDRLGDTPLQIEYAKVSSYEGKERGELNIKYMPEIDWQGKEVIVLDDICDSGNTMNCIYSWLQQFSPASVRFITLIVRKGRCRLNEGVCLTAGIEDMSDDFFVGCGLDDNGKARNLPYIGIVE